MEDIFSTTAFGNFSNDSGLLNDSMSAVSDSTTVPRMTLGEYIDAIYKAGKVLPLYKAGYVFEQLNYWMLPPLALICNSLTLITMIRIKPFTSSSLYICSLAFGDTIALFLNMLNYIVDILDLDMGDYGCGILAFLIYTILHGSIWTIVLMTFERFVAVIFPLKVNSLFTMKRTKISIFLVYLFFSLVDAHFIYTYIMRVSPASWVGRYCGHRLGTELWSYDIWFWINTTIFAVLPSSILLFLNVMIILGMRASSRKQKKMVMTDSSKKDALQTQVTIMLLTMSFCYIIFFLPVCIFQILAIDYVPFESPEFFATFYFTVSFVFLFSSMNHAVNFVFYFASNRRFRTALYQVIRCQAVGGNTRYRPTGSSNNTVITISSSMPS